MCSAPVISEVSPKHAVDALRDQLVVHVAHRRAGGEPGGGVALAALGRHPQLGDAALLALELGGPLQEVLGLRGRPWRWWRYRRAPRCRSRRPACRSLAMPSTTRLVQPSSMPITTTAATLGLAAGADQGAEMQVEVGAELQPPIGVRQRQRALDVVGHRLAGGVRRDRRAAG